MKVELGEPVQIIQSYKRPVRLYFFLNKLNHEIEEKKPIVVQLRALSCNWKFRQPPRLAVSHEGIFRNTVPFGRQTLVAEG